jgi:hypothetical protein
VSLGLADLGGAPAGAFVVPARLGLIGAVVWGVTLSSVIGLSLSLPVRDLAVWLGLGVASLCGLCTAGLGLLLEGA